MIAANVPDCRISFYVFKKEESMYRSDLEDEFGSGFWFAFVVVVLAILAIILAPIYKLWTMAIGRLRRAEASDNNIESVADKLPRSKPRLNRWR